MRSLTNKKRLRFDITLGADTFGNKGNKVSMMGFRATADITKVAGIQTGELIAKIFGVSQSDMDSITTLVMQSAVNGAMVYMPNTIEVFAIDGDTETLVFTGNIVNAWGDYQGAPDVFLYIKAQAGLFNQLRSATPSSTKGAVDVATLMGQLAKDMGYKFESNGVKVTLTDVYLANTKLEQAKELARAAGVDFVLDDDTVAIVPRNGSRAGIVPIISPSSGLVGYPTFDANGVLFQTLFDPAIRFMGEVILKTSIKRAEGTWTVLQMSHRLESETPGGAWFSTVRCNFRGSIYVGK
jgi:hypothetical protein